jgi:hypothetical protein
MRSRREERSIAAMPPKRDQIRIVPYMFSYSDKLEEESR